MKPEQHKPILELLPDGTWVGGMTITAAPKTTQPATASELEQLAEDISSVIQHEALLRVGDLRSAANHILKGFAKVQELTRMIFDTQQDAFIGVGDACYMLNQAQPTSGKQKQEIQQRRSHLAAAEERAAVWMQLASRGRLPTEINNEFHADLAAWKEKNK